MKRCVVLLSALSALACGSDFRAPSLETTGQTASPLGEVIDLEVALPALQINGATHRGIDMEIQFDLEQSGSGKIPTRVTFGPARVDRHFTEVEDLSDGRISLFVDGDSWTTARIGPLRIENTAFEVILDGDKTDGGWVVEGRSWESQTGLYGTFRGWRRHRFLVAGSDFFSSAGRVSEVSWVKEREVRVRERLELVSSDPHLRAIGGAVFAVNRLSFDNLQRLDPLADFATSWQAGVGAGSNPHDALMLSSEKAYATRYEPPFDDVVVFDPQRGEIVGTISLAGLAENEDGTPRPDRLALADGTVFVGLQDIDRTFTHFAEGKLVVVDPEIDEVVGVIPLGGKNPGEIEPHVGRDGRARLYVALAGIFAGLQPQELSGGVVVVDVLNRVVERIALDDDVVGGNIASLEVVSDTLAYAVVSDADFTNRVIAFDPERGELLRTVSSHTELVPEIETDSRGVLAVPDRNPVDPRLCLYRPPTADQQSETLIWCVAVELPSFSIEALD